MDAESLKIILNLQHMASMHERIFLDILISLSPGRSEPMPEYNYNIDTKTQGMIGLIMGDIKKLRERVEELENQQNQTENT